MQEEKCSTFRIFPVVSSGVHAAIGIICAIMFRVVPYLVFFIIFVPFPICTAIGSFMFMNNFYYFGYILTIVLYIVLEIILIMITAVVRNHKDIKSLMFKTEEAKYEKLTLIFTIVFGVIGALNIVICHFGKEMFRTQSKIQKNEKLMTSVDPILISSDNGDSGKPLEPEKETLI